MSKQFEDNEFENQKELTKNELVARIQYLHDILQTYHNELNSDLDDDFGSPIEKRASLRSKIDHNAEIINHFIQIFESTIYQGAL